MLSRCSALIVVQGPTSDWLTVDEETLFEEIGMRKVEEGS